MPRPIGTILQICNTVLEKAEEIKGNHITDLYLKVSYDTKKNACICEVAHSSWLHKIKEYLNSTRLIRAVFAVLGMQSSLDMRISNLGSDTIEISLSEIANLEEFKQSCIATKKEQLQIQKISDIQNRLEKTTALDEIISIEEALDTTYKNVIITLSGIKIPNNSDTTTIEKSYIEALETLDQSLQDLQPILQEFTTLSMSIENKKISIVETLLENEDFTAWPNEEFFYFVEIVSGLKKHLAEKKTENASQLIQKLDAFLEKHPLKLTTELKTQKSFFETIQFQSYIEPVTSLVVSTGLTYFTSGFSGVAIMGTTLIGTKIAQWIAPETMKLAESNGIIQALQIGLTYHSSGLQGLGKMAASSFGAGIGIQIAPSIAKVITDQFPKEWEHSKKITEALVKVAIPIGAAYTSSQIYERGIITYSQYKEEKRIQEKVLIEKQKILDAQNKIIQKAKAGNSLTENEYKQLSPEQRIWIQIEQKQSVQSSGIKINKLTEELKICQKLVDKQAIQKCREPLAETVQATYSYIFGLDAIDQYQIWEQQLQSVSSEIYSLSPTQMETLMPPLDSLKNFNSNQRRDLIELIDTTGSCLSQLQQESLKNFKAQLVTFDKQQCLPPVDTEYFSNEISPQQLELSELDKTRNGIFYKSVNDIALKNSWDPYSPKQLQYFYEKFDIEFDQYGRKLRQRSSWWPWH